MSLLSYIITRSQISGGIHYYLRNAISLKIECGKQIIGAYPLKKRITNDSEILPLHFHFEDIFAAIRNADSRDAQKESNSCDRKFKCGPDHENGRPPGKR